MNRAHARPSPTTSAAGMLVVCLVACLLGRVPAPSPPVNHTPPTSSTAPAQPPSELTDRILATSLRRATEADAVARDAILAELAALPTATDSPGFLRALPPGLLDTPPASDALARWSAQDPAGALEWLAGLSQPPPHLVVTTLQAWLDRDPDTLGQHLATLPSGPWQQQLLGLAGRLALRQNRPADAVVWFSRIAPANRAEPELHWAARAWGRADPDAALEWAAARPDPAAQETLLSAALLGHATANPGQALDLALGLLDPGPARDHALADLLGEWARLNPAEASAALARIPEGDARTLALTALLAAWHDYDPAGARSWAGARNAGADRERATSRLALIEAQHFPHPGK